MKAIIGTIVSTKMKNTVIVDVPRQRFHPLYKKIMRRSSRYKAHNQNIELKVGDKVKIGSCKPISKEKHFRVLEKIDI